MLAGSITPAPGTRRTLCLRSEAPTRPRWLTLLARPAPAPTLPCPTTDPRSGVNDQLIAVVLTIERFWRPALINSVLPVLLVAFLVRGSLGA